MESGKKLLDSIKGAKRFAMLIESSGGRRTIHGFGNVWRVLSLHSVLPNDNGCRRLAVPFKFMMTKSAKLWWKLLPRRAQRSFSVRLELHDKFSQHKFFNVDYSLASAFSRGKICFLSPTFHLHASFFLQPPRSNEKTPFTL